MNIRTLPTPNSLPITEPGLYHISAADYHSGALCDAPCLSSSIANVMLDQSPRHAYAQHPKLGGTYEDEPTRQKEIGTAAHRVLFGRGAEIVVIDANDYKSGAAKAQRKRAYAENRAPILRDDQATVEAMVEAARDQLLAFPELRPLVDGKGHSEVAMLWREGDISCKGMVDWLSPDLSIRADLKSTSASAHPAAISSRLFGCGTELQNSFYGRGLHRLGVPCRTSVFICQEASEPYALSVCDLDAVAEQVGAEKVERAIMLWARCLAENDWPGYEPLIATCEYPAWALRAWTARALAADAALHVGGGRPICADDGQDAHASAHSVLEAG